jgi:hypothetical protein
LAVSATWEGKIHHFNAILNQVGKGLNAAVAENDWCKRHGVLTGADYLRVWCAMLFQNPAQHLPLLYFYSWERETGKSSFHRALALMFSRGCVEGVRMLNEQFNKLFAGAVLVYLEEERVDPKAAQKIKLYVDSDRVTIRMMRTDTFMVRNFTHWIATYNFKDGIPVEPGDERIVMVHVPVLMDDEKLDWTTELRPALEAEASDFLGTLMNMELPPSAGRLYLPVLMTDLKREVTQAEVLTCDRNELLDRVVQKITEAVKFRGQSRQFQELLGEGSWSKSPNHLRRYLGEIGAQLDRASIDLDLSDPKLLSLKIRP